MPTLQHISMALSNYIFDARLVHDCNEHIRIIHHVASFVSPVEDSPLSTLMKQTCRRQVFQCSDLLYMLTPISGQ